MLGVPDTPSVRLSCHSLVFFWAAVGRAAAACTHAVVHTHAHHSRSHSRDWTSHLLTIPHATVNYCSVSSCFSVWAAGMSLVWCLFPCLNRYNHVSRLHKFTEVSVRLFTVCWRLSFIVFMGYLWMLLHFENMLLVKLFRFGKKNICVGYFPVAMIISSLFWSLRWEVLYHVLMLLCLVNDHAARIEIM